MRSDNSDMMYTSRGDGSANRLFVKELLLALEPFARIAAISEPLHLAKEMPLREMVPGSWPIHEDCIKALKLYRDGLRSGYALDSNLKEGK